MLTVQSPMTVADYCAGLNRSELQVNQLYQRSDKVWPPAARSFLIESIILGYPLPKIFLFQKTDLKSKKTVKEIVDGQQRTRAIHDFFNNKLSISKKSELGDIAGRKYDQLSDDTKGRFLNYQLSIDLFVSATPSEIREAFRRLNSYTVPLNPEELRHAEYQGDFKWFVYDVTQLWDAAIAQVGVLGAKQIVRMQDAKLWTEFSHAILNGIKTTKAKDLTALYKKYEKEGSFTQIDEFKARIAQVMEFVVETPEIQGGPLMKPHVFYTLALALTHRFSAVPTLAPIFEPQSRDVFDKDVAVANLSVLASAIEAEDASDYASFKAASSEKTNVDTQRIARFRWLSRALEPELI